MAVIGVEHRHDALQNDDAVVEVLIHEVARAAGHPDAVVEGLLLRIEPWESGQKRGVDVEDAVWERGNEIGREQAHVTGQADEVDVVLPEGGEHFGIVVCAGTPLGDMAAGRKAECASGSNAGGVGNVGDDDGDLYVSKAAFPDGLSDGQEIGTTAGKENADADRPSGTFHEIHSLNGVDGPRSASS